MVETNATEGILELAMLVAQQRLRQTLNLAKQIMWPCPISEPIGCHGSMGCLRHSSQKKNGSPNKLIFVCEL